MARGVGDPCPRRMQVEPGQKLLSSAPAPSAYPNPVKKAVSQDPILLPNLQLPIRNTSHVIADESGFGIIPQDPEKLRSVGLRLGAGAPGARIVRASGRAARWTAPCPACFAAHCAVRSAGILASRVPVPKRSPEERGCEGDRTVDFHIQAHIKGLGQRQKEEVFFRKIFILQLVELVLTYNFTDCDFKNIKDIYQDVIHPELNVYINGTKSIRFNKFVYCEDAPDCLIKIEHFTFKPIYGCASLAKETFAKQTNATLSLRCSGYSGIQINNTQTMKKRRKREVKTDKCLEQVSYLIELWRRFSRIS
ncbi:thymic stromal lymphopoietin [Lagenorhynchus albirostris]|uniref:thymic stromal lymphopoietin n=1 Tax=Lagenorhynchus albirostris TaxID=27610 RepID=UPI0028E40B25|nr:thymic stromal lymphopoietin [Lagenorhynchus albirostris]